MKTYADSTLKGYSKEQLIGIIRCLEHNVTVTEERNENQFAMLMEREKYRWHDLRKNPEDLPNNDGLYAVAINFSDEIEIGFGEYETIYGYGRGWGALMPNIQAVIAWKEIEPFS